MKCKTKGCAPHQRCGGCRKRSLKHAVRAYQERVKRIFSKPDNLGNIRVSMSSVQSLLNQRADLGRRARAYENFKRKGKA